MKASILTAVLLCAVGAAAAQTPNTNGGAPDHGAQRMERLAVLLDLNDGQKAQVQTVLQEEHAKAMQFFQQAKASGTRPTPQQMQAQHQQMQAETLQKLSTVLTESQLKKFQVLQQEHGGPRGFHHQGPPPSSAPANGTQN
jgi:hypothetical protein